MPTILRVSGFQVRMFSNDHPPAHVHVFKAGTVVVINLGSITGKQVVRDVIGMSDANAVKAFRIVQAHSDWLWQKWGEIHD